jgi:transcriptional regulator with XRE-family HTH domain
METVHPLRSYRRRAELSQSALGEALGVSKSLISRWESGTRSPRLPEIVAIERLTGGAVTANDFLTSPVEASVAS